MLVVDKVRIRGNMFGGMFVLMQYIQWRKEDFSGRVGCKLEL